MKKLFSIKYSDNGVSLAALVLRLGFGGLMLVKGYDKLLAFGSKASTFMDPLHVGHTTSYSLVVFAEFFCAAFLIIGLFTRLACIPLIIDMAVALFIAHNGEVFGAGGSAATFLIGYLALLFIGPGKVSLDKLIGK
jgi:putative oxidoreductase